MALRILRAASAILLLVIGAAVLGFGMSSRNAANRDVLGYWAAGRQLVHRADPYDGPEVLRLEHAAGFLDSRPFFMRNPPTAFPFVLLFGLLSIKAAAIVWSLSLIAALMLSIRMVWIMSGRPPDRLHLIGYLFPPVLGCLLAGQMGLVLLLGVTAFLFFHEHRPYLAGVCLAVCALKPQLFLPFGVVLVVWAVAGRAYRILIGAGSALALDLVLAWALDPSGWARYFAMLKAADLKDEFIPTISLMLRLSVHREAVWLQFVPVSLACIWALWYFRHKQWSWLTHGSLLLIVSILCAPYAWFTDEAIVLPAILLGLYRVSLRARMVFACLVLIGVVEVIVGLRINSGFYLWTCPAWLIWYLYAMRQDSHCDQNVLQSTAPRAKEIAVNGA